MVGAPQFQPGEEAVLFLSAQGPSVAHVFGLSQGVFRVRVDARTGSRLVLPPVLMAAGESSRSGDARRAGPHAAAARCVRRDRSCRHGAGARRALRRVARCSPLALVAAASVPAAAYLKLGIAGRHAHGHAQVERRCRSGTSSPTAASPAVTSQQLQQAVQRAFATWDAVPTATDALRVRRVHGMRLRVAATARRSLVFRVARTSTARSARPPSSSTPRPATSSNRTSSSTARSVVGCGPGRSGGFDLESIALHEIGHLHGLAHSALGETELRSGGRRVIAAESVMFPIAFSAGSIAFRTLAGRRHRRDFGYLPGHRALRGRPAASAAR